MRILSQMLIDLGAERQVRAKKYERPSLRKTHRNGYQQRVWEIRVGESPLSIPKLKEGDLITCMVTAISSGFTGKSQEAPQLAVGRNGKRGFGGGSLHYGFFLGISLGQIARTSSRNKMKSCRFEAPGRFTGETRRGKLKEIAFITPILYNPQKT